MKDDEKMKVLKWNFGQPRREHVDQLKDQMHPCVNATVLAQLFHDDFKKHIAALETFTKVRTVLMEVGAETATCVSLCAVGFFSLLSFICCPIVCVSLVCVCVCVCCSVLGVLKEPL